MGEQTEEYKFSYKEVVEALIKKQGLHEGIWMIGLQFGIGAMNIKNPDTKEPPVPAAVVPIIGITLRKRDALNPLALDAAVVNPKPKKR